MRKNNKYRPTDLHLAQVGLTAEELNLASDEFNQTELNLSCSAEACHIATNEFDLVSFVTVD